MNTYRQQADITIPEEALTAGREAFVRCPIGRSSTHAAIEAAAPFIADAARADELTEQAAALMQQAEAFGFPCQGTPASGMVTVLVELAQEFRDRAADLRGSGQLAATRPASTPDPVLDDRDEQVSR